jgi:hypothetical protein
MQTRFVWLLAVPVAAAGWWAIHELTGRVWPDQPGVQLLFFALLFPTLTATLALPAAYLNRRFAPQATDRAPWRFLRHSVEGALCLSSWVWLQMHQAFNVGFAFIIALIFVTVEVFIVRMKGES